MKMITKRIVCLLLALVLCFSLVACSTKEEASTSAKTEETSADPKTEETSATSEASSKEETAVETVKVGFLAPLSGPSASTGNASYWAVQMFVDVINNSNDMDVLFAQTEGLPNLNGAKIELVVGDTKGETETIASECRRLIEEGCVAICGQFNSASTMTAAVITEQYGIPLLTAGTSPTLTADDAEYEYLFRFGPNDHTYMKDTFEMLKEVSESGKCEVKTIAIMNEDSESGTNTRKLELEYAETYGFEIVEDITYTPNSTTLSSEVLKLQASGADALITNNVAASDAILLMRTCKDLNYFPKLFMGQRGGYTVDDYRMSLGADSEYVYTTAGAATDLGKACMAQICEKYLEFADEGYALNEGVVRDSVNVLLIAAAINQAASTDPEAIKDALFNLDVNIELLPIAWHGIEVNEHGQNTLATGVIQQIIDGEWVTVYPSATANQEYVVPAPAWNER